MLLDAARSRAPINEPRGDKECKADSGGPAKEFARNKCKAARRERRGYERSKHARANTGNRANSAQCNDPVGFHTDPPLPDVAPVSYLGPQVT